MKNARCILGAFNLFVLARGDEAIAELNDFADAVVTGFKDDAAEGALKLMVAMFILANRGNKDMVILPLRNVNMPFEGLTTANGEQMFNDMREAANRIADERDEEDDDLAGMEPVGHA